MLPELNVNQTEKGESTNKREKVQTKGSKKIMDKELKILARASDGFLLLNSRTDLQTASVINRKIIARWGLVTYVG